MILWRNLHLHDGGWLYRGDAKIYLTPQQDRLISLFMRAQGLPVSLESQVVALRGDRPRRHTDPKTLRVVLCTMRLLLDQVGVRIVSLPGGQGKRKMELESDEDAVRSGEYQPGT